MNNTQKSTDDILSAIKDLMEGNETVSKSNDAPLPDDVLELTKPITEDVLELTTPIENNNDQVLKNKEEDVLELNQMVDENMKVVDLSAHVQSNILDEIDEDLVRRLVKSRLKESLENKIDIIIKEVKNIQVVDGGETHSAGSVTKPLSAAA